MYIEKSLLINLPERTDRLDHAQKQIVNVGFPNTFDVIPAIKTENRGSFTHTGEMGCYLSHLQCLEIAKQNKNGHTLIMEDDLIFSDNFSEMLPLYLEQLDKDDCWDVFYFYNTSNNIFNFRIIKDIPTKAAHFFLINKKSTDFIYELIRRREVSIDGSLYSFAKSGLIKMYSAGQQLVCQNTALSSNIHKGRLSWFRRNFNGVCV